jgi:hypothetical protein
VILKWKSRWRYFGGDALTITGRAREARSVLERNTELGGDPKEFDDSKKTIGGAKPTAYQNTLIAHRSHDDAAKAAPNKAEAVEPTYTRGLVLALGIKRYTLGLKTSYALDFCSSGGSSSVTPTLPNTLDLCWVGRW